MLSYRIARIAQAGPGKPASIPLAYAAVGGGGNQGFHAHRQRPIESGTWGTGRLSTAAPVGFRGPIGPRPKLVPFEREGIKSKKHICVCEKKPRGAGAGGAGRPGYHVKLRSPNGLDSCSAGPDILEWRVRAKAIGPFCDATKGGSRKEPYQTSRSCIQYCALPCARRGRVKGRAEFPFPQTPPRRVFPCFTNYTIIP